MRALIVDDEPTVRLLLSRILRREVDCVVTEATNGVEALDLLGRHHFDFVVIDVMMPIMDGIETLEAIRSTPDLQHMPVMILSAVREEAQVRRLVALGVSAYLTKPLRPSDASGRVKRFVSSLSASSTTTPSAPGRTLHSLADGARLLVVDGDPEFLRFVGSTLGRQYQVIEAEGGVQGLRACLDTRPAAILLGQNLGAVGAPMLLRKLRSQPSLANVPVVALVSRGGEPVPDADLVMPRSFVADAFRAEFARLVTGEAPAPRQSLTRADLRPQVISATEQVFGMMLGVEVQATASAPAQPAARADLARVTLALPDGDADLEFGLWAGREIGERMTAILTPSADVVSQDDVYSTLQEIANIIAGRIQNAIRNRGNAASLGLPSVTSLEQDLPMAEDWTSVEFHDVSGDIRFATFVRPISRSGVAAPAAAEGVGV